MRYCEQCFRHALCGVALIHNGGHNGGPAHSICFHFTRRSVTAADSELDLIAPSHDVTSAVSQAMCRSETNAKRKRGRASEQMRVKTLRQAT